MSEDIQGAQERVADGNQSKKGQAGAKRADATSSETGDPRSPAYASLSEKQRGELWIYIAVSIVAVELLVAVGAIIYGFMGSGLNAGQHGFAFPWLYWAAMAVITPALILLLVHFADVGLFRSPVGGTSEQEWQQHLPQRVQRLYRIVKGAPVAVVLLGVAALGAALMTIDGALGLVLEFAAALKPHIPYLVGAVAGTISIIALAVIWLNYRTRRLIAEYQFRREVLEKTGVIIVDKGSTALPPGGISDVPYMLVSGEEGAGRRTALPAGDGNPDAREPAGGAPQAGTLDTPAEPAKETGKAEEGSLV